MKYLVFLFLSITFIYSLAPDELKLTSYDIDDFNTDYDEDSCKKVIDILINLVEEVYVFNDIAKNPPDKEYYGVINIVEEFRKINTKNRKYYDFYRDIKRVIAKLKDLHFLFTAKNNTIDGVQIDTLMMCLPLSLNVKGNSSENAAMYVEHFQGCQNLYPDEDINFINNHLDIPLKSINQKSPFDFIQNFSVEYLNFKSKHGVFSLIMEYFNFFPLYLLPLSKEESTNIEFTFNDGLSIKLNYTLIPYQANKIKKNTLKENEIKWKYHTKNPKGFYCLIDDENQVNVFKQSDFKLEEDTEEVIKKCTEEFYNNPYPIIGIEAGNLGGSAYAAVFVQQYIQPKILARHHEAFKYNNYLKKYFEENFMMKKLVK